MGSVSNRLSQHNFAMVPDVQMTRSKFDRSFGVKDAIFFDYLTPIMVDEILPGDTVNLTLNTFARLATQVVPLMDNLYIDFFFFFVPNRLVWDHWEKFCGSQDNPGDSISYVVPSLAAFAANNPAVDTIFDKMGLPTNVPGAWTCQNALPFRAYNLIWNSWFRDQNLQNSVTVPTDDGPDPLSTYTLKKRGMRHDYFSSCLPSPQKGSTAVTLPLGTTAPVSRYSSAAGSTSWKVTGTNTNATAGNISTTVGITIDPSSQTINFDPGTTLYADLTNASAATINALRQAFQIQSLLELDARGGTRYVEILQAHFNVTSPDFRLQRPEYLGGGHTRINSHPVAQTSPTSGSNYLAQLGSFATAASTGTIGFTHSFVEHGYIIGLASPRADVTYQQGLNKMWSRQTRYDFFWPKLQQLGEQAVLNQEIYLAGAGGTDTGVFGYQERYGEYRYMPSQIRGQFRSTYATPLDQWHMGIKFNSVPALNSTFIQSNTPIVRNLANSTAPHILIDMAFSYKHARPMLSYAVPLSLGRF